MSRFRLMPLLRSLLILPLATLHLLRTAFRDARMRQDFLNEPLNDVSRLNPTTVRKVIRPSGSVGEIEIQVREALAKARRFGVGVSVMGARHSMGGHTLVSNGFVLDLSELNTMAFDENQNVVSVGSGARWCDVLPFLAEYGRTIKVMQAYSSFTVGGSVSVNCHGDQYGCGPISSTVVSVRLMLSSGETVTCSRNENSRLFSLVIGGYGLFGMILQVKLRVTKNRSLRRKSSVLSVGDAVKAIERIEKEGLACETFYARMCTTKSALLTKCLFVTTVAEQTAPPVHRASSWKDRLYRTVYIGGLRNTFGQYLRWFLESEIVPAFDSGVVSRRTLLEERAENYENRTGKTTEVIQEYFLPPEQMVDFIQAARRCIMDAGANVVNSSLRVVERDNDSFLCYARQRMLTIVLTIHRRIDNREDDEMMTRLTRKLIDTAIEMNGSFYLPYRLQATHSQMQKAYPMLAEFFAAKHKYDPTNTLRNCFWSKYGEPSVAAETN